MVGGYWRSLAVVVVVVCGCWRSLAGLTSHSYLLALRMLSKMSFCHDKSLVDFDKHKIRYDADYLLVCEMFKKRSNQFTDT